MRYFDFSTWQGILTSIGGLLLITMLGMGVRILMMLTLQQRQQRMNRQINERLRTLIAAYKVLGGSFTGTLTVDPTHMRSLRQKLTEEGAEAAQIEAESQRLQRSMQVRDQVEASLADIILLGTEEQVRLAARAAQEMAEGKPIHTAELVVSLRDYIREALDLGPMPKDVTIPAQGPTRPASGGPRGGGRQGGGAGGAGGGGGGGGMGGAMGGGGMGMGMGMGMGLGTRSKDDAGSGTL